MTEPDDLRESLIALLRLPEVVDRLACTCDSIAARLSALEKSLPPSVGTVEIGRAHV